MNLTGDQFVWLASACIAGLVAAWLGLFLALRNHPGVLDRLFSEGFFLRMITVVFIVIAASILSAVDKLTSDLSTILAAVAGFVLGSAGRQQNEPADKGK